MSHRSGWKFSSQAERSPQGREQRPHSLGKDTVQNTRTTAYLAGIDHMHLAWISVADGINVRKTHVILSAPTTAW